MYGKEIKNGKNSYDQYHYSNLVIMYLLYFLFLRVDQEKLSYVGDYAFDFAGEHVDRVGKKQKSSRRGLF